VDFERLAEHIQKAEVQRRILGSYSGPYSLGVTADPEDAQQPAISVRVAATDTSSIPKTVTVDGQEVKVVSHPDFTAPKPF